jgi:hypothetical protein
VDVLVEAVDGGDVGQRRPRVTGRGDVREQPAPGEREQRDPADGQHDPDRGRGEQPERLDVDTEVRR